MIASRSARSSRRAALLPGLFFEFLDPRGNRAEIVECRDIQFTKAPDVMAAMGLDADKGERARREFADKGMMPDYR